jgi:glycosyltransferase involved in cell wall biosynthesis
MKICQVISSNIPILPTGQRRWGAIELIIDEYAKKLRILGHEVDVKYLNEIQPNQYDIVHIHVANLCLEAKTRGIPYICSTHDHHSYFHGKGSWNYNQQLEAIKGSIFSLAPAEYVVDYFDTDKLFYLSHGVDTDYYLPNLDGCQSCGISHKLLMCANNGVAGDSSSDRKGFRFGVEAAKILNLPITIVGADANTQFFQIHKDLLEYSKLTVIDSNPNEADKLNIFKKHTIFLHPSNLEYGHPNLTLLEAASMCMPIVGTYKGSKVIEGMNVISEISTEEVVQGIKNIIPDYKNTRKKMIEVRKKYDWIHILIDLEKKYEAILKFQILNSDTVKNIYYNTYTNDNI